MTAPLATRPVQPVTLGAPRPTSTDLPGLARVGAKLSRAMQDAMAALGGAPKVVCGEVRTTTFSEWKAALGTNVAIGRYKERAVKGGMLVSAPVKLVAALVDIFYGGTGDIDGSRKHIGVADQRLFMRFAERLGSGMVPAWSDVAAFDPELTGCVFDAESVAFGKPDISIVVQQFAVHDARAGKGVVEIVYPLAALRAIVGLHEVDGEVEPVEIDSAWRNRMSDAVMQARLPVRTILARPTVPLSQLLALAPGDVIPLTLPARVPVTVAGRLMAHGTIGEANGRAAIKIDKIEQGNHFDD